MRQGCWQRRVVGAGATADRFAAPASTPGDPGLHSRRQGDMTQRQSAWTQSAQLAFGVIADLCLEFTAIESIATRPRHETHAARQRSISIVTRANVTMVPTQKSSWKNQKGATRRRCRQRRGPTCSKQTELDTSVLVRRYIIQRYYYTKVLLTKVLFIQRCY